MAYKVVTNEGTSIIEASKYRRTDEGCSFRDDNDNEIAFVRNVQEVMPTDSVKD